MQDELKEKVINANIEYHTKFLDSYEDQPHFLPENKERIKNLLLKYGRQSGFGSLLDIGCGTGFIIDIAKEYFENITGIDITPKMIEKINCTKNVNVYIANAESLPFENNIFNVCTAHAFLHHILEFKSSLKEIYRVLKKGGILYTDQDPNLHFWDSGIAESVLKKYKKEKNIPEELTKLAEYHNALGGINGDEMEDLLRDIGFKDIKVIYRWFVPIKPGEENKRSNMKYIRMEARK